LAEIALGKRNSTATYWPVPSFSSSYAPQTRVEGEIQNLPPDYPVIELWRVIAGQEYGRTDASQITLFDSVGFAIEDFSARRYVRTKLLNEGLFEELELLADPDDPRDLFGMLLRHKPS
jgi:ornithine cyclodeaminase